MVKTLICRQSIVYGGLILGYIEKNLMEGERIIATAHMHYIAFLGPIILTLIVLLFFGGARWLVIFPIIWLVITYWYYSSAEFGVTNRRIIAKWGVFSRHSTEMNLDKVEGVTINEGMIGSKLGYGSVVVTGTGGSHEPFPNIANPMEFRQKILEHTTRHLKEDIPTQAPT